MILAERILAHTEKIKEIEAGRFPVPVSAVLHFSYLCNQNCKGCAYKKLNNGHILNSYDAFRIVKELMGFGIYNFEFGGGGEPTMIPYLDTLIEVILANKGNYGILTNGVEMDKVKELIARTASYIRISVEYGNQEAYCAYKNVSAAHYEKLKENVKYLVENRSPETQLSLKFITDDYGDFKDFKFDSFQHKNLSGGDYKTDYPEIKKCYLTPLYTVIDAYGDVYLCCYYYDRKEQMKIGNVLQDHFKDIWGSERHREVINNIDLDFCRRYDCRFFKYHQIYEESKIRGRLNFL